MSASSRQIEEELYAELKMLWRQTLKPDEKLGKTFQEQKKNFLAAIIEEDHGD